MVKRKTWEEFREVGLLWWINRMLHFFGWAVVFQIESDGSISDVYPARVKFRGFTPDCEKIGFIALSDYFVKHGKEIANEAHL